MQDCLFCKIVKKEIPAKIVYESDFALAFEDISPQAPKHILVIPKEHFATVADIKDEAFLGKLIIAANQIAKEQNIAEGYRLVINKGEQAGQTVFHLHIHILGGRTMQWPPG